MSRPLFFYVKKAHLGVIPGLKEYVEFFLSDDMIGPDSPLADYGLVSAPDAERDAAPRQVRSRHHAVIHRARDWPAGPARPAASTRGAIGQRA